jgi:hypothetical protein
MEEYNNFGVQYEMFLAEQELYNSLIEDSIYFENNIIQLDYLTEAIQDTIARYIDKIVNAVSKVWGEFKQRIGSSKDQKYLYSIKQIIENAHPKFNINDYPIYSMTNLSNIRIQIFNYETMKENLNSKSKYLERYYPTLRVKKGNTMRQTVRGICVTRVMPSLPCTAEVLNSMYEFCTKDFFTYRDRILKRDIQDLNKSLSAIAGFANATTGKTIAAESAVLCEQYLSEAIPSATPTDRNNKAKTSYSDSPSANSNNKADTAQISTIKQISNYVDVTAKIISAKMNMMAECYNLYMKTLKHYTVSAKAEKAAGVNSGENKQELKTQVQL